MMSTLKSSGSGLILILDDFIGEIPWDLKWFLDFSGAGVNSWHSETPA